MVGVNHVTTGVLVAVAIDKPVVAFPVAFASHFLIDALPHWDYKIANNQTYRQLAMMLDLTFSLSLLLIFSVSLDAPTRLIISCGFLALLPDAMWLPELAQGRKLYLQGPGLLYKLRRLHAKIQWSETQKGLYVEIAWFFLVLVLIIQLS